MIASLLVLFLGLSNAPALSIHPGEVYLTFLENGGALWDQFSFDLRIPLSKGFANPGRVTINLYDINDVPIAINQLLWDPPPDFDFSKLHFVLIPCRSLVPGGGKVARAEIWILPGDPRPQSQANITVSLKHYQTKGSYNLPVNGWWSLLPDGAGLAPVAINNPADIYSWNFVKRSEEGLLYKGKQGELFDYVGYNQPVLACQDGKVVKVQSGYRDNKINEELKYDTLTDLWGNYIIVDHSNGEYSYYAHLAPGTIKVKPGQKVMRGMEIGKVGNSGYSRIPHLSFGFVDRVNPFKNPNSSLSNFDPANVQANSLPVTFDSFIWHEAGNKLMKNADPKPSWTVANLTPEIISQTEGE